MSTSKPIKVKARTKTFVHADPNAKASHDLTIGVIEGIRHTGEISHGWAYIDLHRSGTEFSIALTPAGMAQLHTELGNAIAKLRQPPKECDRTDCYYCKQGKYATP